MENLKPQDIKALVEKIVWLLRKENIYVFSCEVRERPSKYEVYLKLEKNIAGVSTIKMVFNKNKLKYRIFTGKTSLDMRLKRFIQRELLKMAGRHEIASQKEGTNSGSTTK